MKYISRVFSVIITAIVVLFGLAQNVAAQNYCPEMAISIVDSLSGATINAPDPFPDNNLQKIHYTIAFDDTLLPMDQEYNVYTDDGIGYPLDYDYGFGGSNFHRPAIGAGGKWRLTADILKPNRFGEKNRAFEVWKHTLNVQDRRLKRLCSTTYEIVPGLTQIPIQCDIALKSDLGDGTLMSAHYGFTVSIKLSPISDFDRARKADRKLFAVSPSLPTTPDILAEKANNYYEPFTIVSQDEYTFHVEKGRLLPAKYVVSMEFTEDLDPTNPTKIGACSSIEFEICPADKPCALPSNTPTPSLTPTDNPRCATECDKKQCGRANCSQCKICRPSKPPLPPFPSLQPICTQLGQGPGSACRECIDNGKLWTAIGCVPTNMGDFVTDYVFVYGVGIAGGIAFLYFIYGCFLILTSAGNAERVEEAKSIITSALSGLLLIIFSIVLLRLIGVDILRLPGFS